MLDKQITVSAKNNTPISDEIHTSLSAKLFAHAYMLDDKLDNHVETTIQQQYRPALHALETNILAHIPKDFIHTRLPSKHHPHGSELAPWVSRSMFKAARKVAPDIDFALHNAGGVRQSLNKGNLSLADVIGRILPFELPLVLYQLHGQSIIDALESAIDAATNNGVVGTGAGSFPYTYGLRFHYDGKQNKGQRLTMVEVYRQQWISLDPEALYIGVSSAYTAAGKEGYDALKRALWQQSIDHCTLPEAFVDYVTQYGHRLENTILPPNVHYASHR